MPDMHPGDVYVLPANAFACPLPTCRPSVNFVFPPLSVSVRGISACLRTCPACVCTDTRVHVRKERGLR